MNDTVIIPDELSVDELGEQIVSLAGRVAAATCRWLLLVVEFDRREGYGRCGLYSTARWLSHHCGIAHRTAVEHVRVARALAGSPRLVEEMSAGRLSYTQVRAITRVPREGEQRLVADLIEIAQHGSAAQLETMVRGLRTVDVAQDGPGDASQEYIRFGWTDTSHGTVGARLLPERAEVVHAAVRELARAEQISEADALVRIAEIALVSLNDSAGEGTGAVRPLRGDERAALVVHIHAPASRIDDRSRSAERGRDDRIPRSAERDAGPDTEPASDVPAGRISNGPGLAAAVVERLLCSARVRAVVHGADGNVRDLGRSRRLVSKRRFAALLARDGHCRHPGCTSISGLDAHHIVFWSRGGSTDLNNLVLLCAAHHHRLHDGAFALNRASDGRLVFVRPDGTVLPDFPKADRPAADPWAIDRDTDTEPAAARNRWDGQRLDRHYAISVLATRRDEAARLVRAG